MPNGTPPADTLRTAATKLRALATTATAGPWREADTHLGQYGHTATVLSGSGNDTALRAWLPSMSQEPWDETRNVWADAAYIAAMHPGVGLLLAEWLGSVADSLQKIQDAGADPAAYVHPNVIAIARVLLGGDA